MKREIFFKSPEEFYAAPKFCEAAIISIPDHLHYEPALKVMRAGYHLLLEKPKVAEIPEYKDSGHGGGDHGAFRDFLEAVCWNDPSRMTSSVDVSVESHIMGFDAEKSRKTGRRSIIKMKK